MKREQNPLFKIGSLLMISIFLLLGSSCAKNEFHSDDVAGILSLRFLMSDGRVFDCEIDQINQKISNSRDSLLFGTSETVLEEITPIFSTTLGAEVFLNGQKLVSGESVINLSSPLTLTAQYKGVSREYRTTAAIQKLDYSETSGAKVNTDMSMTGLPPFNSYSAAWFKGKLYILGAYYPQATSPEGTAYYHLYSSTDGIGWEKVETNLTAVGGYGSELIVLEDKMFAFGGGRLWGKDEDGNGPEFSVSWKAFSTTDGTNWIDCTEGQVGAPYGIAFPQLVVHDGKVVLRRGKMFGFGMWQAMNNVNSHQTVDGINWELVTADPITATHRNEDAMYSFNGKLWITGGYANWISEANLRGDIWSSSDNGATWVEESLVINPELVRFGHRVVSNGSKLYMIGGETLEGALRLGTNTVMESTDGINWTPLSEDLQLPSGFDSRIYPSIILGEDDTVWIIGGFAGSQGNYTISGLAMQPRYDVWIKKIK